MDPSLSLPVGKCILAVVLAAAVAVFSSLRGLNSMADIATPGVLLAFTLLGLLALALALAPVRYRRLRFESIKRE
ncbi:MAG: hypothetical protein M3436_12270 [Pseudomonadota bacterium]|nr:hypothetical protein [Pseudomonadota bacterium]